MNNEVKDNSEFLELLTSGLYDYKVTCDESNNSLEDKSENMLNYDIHLIPKPTLITLEFEIDKDGNINQIKPE